METYRPKDAYPNCVDECISCNYYNAEGDLCEALKKLNCCSFCGNALSDLRFQRDADGEFQDGSSCGIGRGDQPLGITGFLNSSSHNQPAPVTISVQKWFPEHSRNHDIWYYVPKYCPECGRFIEENQSYFKKKYKRD